MLGLWTAVDYTRFHCAPTNLESWQLLIWSEGYNFLEKSLSSLSWYWTPYWTLWWVNWNLTSSYPVSLKHVLIFYLNLWRDLPTYQVPLPKLHIPPSCSFLRATCLIHLNVPWINSLIILGRKYKLWSSSFSNFLHLLIRSFFWIWLLPRTSISIWNSMEHHTYEYFAKIWWFLI
jgi:hypothetical protein